MGDEDEEGPVIGEGTRASLLARLSAGPPPERESAWGDFVARYRPVIAGFAARCGASRQDVDDIVQDVLAGFLGASGRFEYDPARGRFRGYLKTCTVRAAVRRAGKNLRFRGVPLESVPDPEAAVGPLWDDLWERQLVGRALLAVREACGASVAFRAFEGYALLDRPAEAVAAELGTTVENVYQAKTRITKRLREAVSRLREAEDGL